MNASDKSQAEVTMEVVGVKQYNDKNFKDIPEEETNSVPIEEKSEDIKKKEENIVKVGQTIIKPIAMEDLTKECQELVKKNGKGWITQNSQCPCNSGKRFKSCCMKLKK